MGQENEKLIEQRRDEAIRRALNTPPSPTKEIKGRTKKKDAPRSASSQSDPKSS